MRPLPNDPQQAAAPTSRPSPPCFHSSGRNLLQGIFTWPLLVSGGVLGVVTYQQGALLWSACGFMGGVFGLMSLVMALALLPRYVRLAFHDGELLLHKPYAVSNRTIRMAFAGLDRVDNKQPTTEKACLLFHGPNQYRRRVSIIPFSPQQRASFAELLRAHAIQAMNF